MILRSAAFFADENVHPAVVDHLRLTKHDVRTVVDSGHIGSADADLLRLATTELRIVLTHDSDFGRLAIADGEPFVGIIYLRPGHITPEFTIDSLETVMMSHPIVNPPFIIVARRQYDRVHIRVREHSG